MGAIGVTCITLVEMGPPNKSGHFWGATQLQA